MKIDNDDKSLNTNFESDSSQLYSEFDNNSPKISIDPSSDDSDIDMTFDSDPDWNVIFELAGDGKPIEERIFYNTTNYWNSRRDLIAKRGYIYIYSDYMTIDEQNVAGIKVGDGSSYLIDMPFIDKLYYNHVNDMVCHITQAERIFWNNKVTCYEIDEHTLVFTKK